MLAINYTNVLIQVMTAHSSGRKITKCLGCEDKSSEDIKLGKPIFVKNLVLVSPKYTRYTITETR